MDLISISYSEFPQESRKWILNEFELNNINLIVGKNAEGKSRTLSLIFNLSNIVLNNMLVVASGNFIANFQKDTDIISYEIQIYNNNVLSEELKINDDVKLVRKTGGRGSMYNEQAGKQLKFELPQNIPAITRRDKLQYPFLEDLHNWALNVRLFKFGTDLGQSVYSAVNSANQPTEFNLRDTARLIDLYHSGIKKFSSDFKKSIIEDFKMIGYILDDIKVGKQHSVVFQGNVGEIEGLLLYEQGRSHPLDQLTISAGMFRALAIIIHFTYYEFSQKAGTVLIDDIGEGLDYERSTNLISLLIKKASKNKIQLIMSTNDRFVMNHVSLNYWQILCRIQGEVTVFNHKNSPKAFDDFKYTGLNNFDFFTTGFYKDGFTEEETISNE